MSSVTKAHSIDHLRQLARRELPKGIFDFFDGGAEDELTLRDNRTAWEETKLRPRVLVNVARVDTTGTLIGSPARLPIAIAPTGAVGYGRANGDVAIAKAARAFGIPYSLSTSATTSIERISAEAPGRLWFQAYVLKDRSRTMRLIERANAAGYEALMVTVDLAVGGKRERDLRNDFSFPFRFTPLNMLQFALRPRWSLEMLTRGMPVLENLADHVPAVSGAADEVSTTGRHFDPSFDWDALALMRSAWRGKLIVKGIVSPPDAVRAVRLGCDCVVVSNHGGRQLDGTIATAHALPDIVKAVDGRASVLVDGGIRRGVDILKALALGADGVLLGRATLFGALAGGEEGAMRALEILQDEFRRSMQLCGVRALNEIGPHLLAPR